jgi:hypothetical protein
MELGRELAKVQHQVATTVARLVVGEWQLFYEAGFADASLTPVKNPLSLQPLQFIWSDNLQNFPNHRRLEVLPTGAVRLTVERPPGEAGLVSVGLVVPGFPDKNLDVFSIQASLKYPRGPSTPTGPGEDDVYVWAPVVIAGKREPGARRIAVSLQAAFDLQGSVAHAAGPGARMNTPGGARPDEFGKCLPPPYAEGSGLGPWIPEAVREKVYASNATVELGCYVERSTNSGVASLETLWVPPQASPNHPVPPPETHSEARRFCHPFIRRTNPSTNQPNIIDEAGLSLAMLSGDGPAEVTLRGLRMYRLVPSRNIFDTFLSVVGPLLARSSLSRPLRRLRESLLEHAYQALPHN